MLGYVQMMENFQISNYLRWLTERGLTFLPVPTTSPMGNIDEKIREVRTEKKRENVPKVEFKEELVVVKGSQSAKALILIDSVDPKRVLWGEERRRLIQFVQKSGLDPRTDVLLCACITNAMSLPLSNKVSYLSRLQNKLKFFENLDKGFCFGKLPLICLGLERGDREEIELPLDNQKNLLIDVQPHLFEL